MRIGIVSDTHDQVARTRTAVKMLADAGAEALFHCGDITEPPLVEACRALKCYYVMGNNDCDMVRQLQSAIEGSGGVFLGWGGQVELAGKRLAMTHGHLTRDLKPLLAAQPDYLFSGHSHIAGDTLQGGVRRINPGALHRAKSFSVALLDLESDELRFLSVPR